VPQFAQALEQASAVSLLNLHSNTRATAPLDAISSPAPFLPVFALPLTSTPLWNIPYRRNPFFAGREDLLTYLRDHFNRERTAALTQSHALSGLGGIGKTQVAVEYAYRFRDDYRGVFWVRAASRETLVADYVTMAGLLDLPERNMPDQLLIVAAVKLHLARHKDWLLILDNADDLSMISDFIPAGGGGHILLTTRAQATGTVAPSIAVDKMDLDEGAQLLLRRSKLLPADALLDAADPVILAQAQAIALAMDGLPLALDQAGAYAEETGCSLSSYLELYRRRRTDLLKRQSSVSPDYPFTVVSTWSLSFQEVENTNRAAADLLRLCAFLDPDAIPEEIITEGASVFPPVLRSVATDAFQLNEAMEVLRRFSLVRRNLEAKVLTIHRLVQAVLKDRMDEQTREQWAALTVRAVNAAFPEVTFSTWQRSRQYLSHALACAGIIDEYRFTFPEAARVLTQVGWYMREHAHFTQAEPLLKRALMLSETTLGAEHPATATVLHNLADLYKAQGKYEQVEPLYLRALAIREQTLDPEHPSIASTLNNLAFHYMNTGKHEQAESFLRRALEIREHTLGSEHPDTSETLNDLAILYQEQGQYAQAEALLQRALAIREHALGLEHPSTAETLHNLSCLYYDMGQYNQAESLGKRALVLYETMLSQEHPNTIIALNQLGRTYLAQGQYAQAEPLLKRALGIAEYLLSPEHYYLRVTVDNLTQLYKMQGQDTQLESLLQHYLATRESMLGSEHPFISHVLVRLARFYQELGCYEQAELYFQRALAIREKALGSEHPDTIAVLENYTDLLQKIDQTTAVATQEGLN
jgi:tetratricopeptide (TPR) repeat protein